MASSHESIVKILIASDIHAGYGENKPIISQDTFHTLDEVLKKAEEKKVHFILMAGDLFHENHPTRETHLKVVRSLRKYCLGAKKPDIQFLSDPAINFQHSQFGNVNFQDSNLKVAMPIFTIHGNHDDLSGKGLTALDVLHEAGLVNLFGKFSDVDEIHVSPLLVTRGNTKIAIYGIGSQRDDRLSRAFSKGRVKFNRPVEDPNSWFSILVLHQNRPPRSKIRSTKAHLSFKSIPSWFDLVIWGHEHECRIEPEIKYPNPADDDRSKSFYIIQPGSTVATSLTIEEAAQKHIGVLHIREKEFKMNKIELETTRQVLIDELILEDSEPNVKISRSTVRPDKLPMPDEPLITQHVEMMLRNAEEKRKPLQPKPPRIRLKVVYSGKWLDLPPINGRKFGQKFEGRVANPNEMIFVRVMKENNNKAKNVGENLSQVLGTRMDDVCSVEEMVNKYFTKCDFKNRLNVLSEIAMGKQLQEYTNTELNTQYKYTAADKSMSEYIKQQLADLTDKVNEKVNSRVDQDSTEDTMERQIMNAIFMAKKERLALNKTNTTTTSAAGGDESNMGTMNETADTLFHERGYDPANIVTSTPRASQEREILWSESMQQPLVASDESQQGGAGGGGGSGAMELDATEFDFSP